MLARALTPRTRQLRIAAASLVGCEPAPGADVSLLVPGADAALVERSYSVGGGSASQGSIDVYVVLHAGGPGSDWAARAQVGDEVRFLRSPAPVIELDHRAQAHLFFGDETSVASAQALARAALAHAAPATAWFEVRAAEDQWPEDGLAAGATAHWVLRRDRRGAALVEALEAGPPLPKAATAYVTGETRLCSLLRAFLVRERAWAPERLRAFPYWKERQLS